MLVACGSKYDLRINSPFGRVVLIGGADWKPENPKTQLGHIWPDNVLYFIPEY